MSERIDVLCAGLACFDLTFAVDQHPGEDHKILANDLQLCGGGPAANAAVCTAKLGCKSAFCGFLGKDWFGDQHLKELAQIGVDTQYIWRGPAPTPLSVCLVKPDGRRSVVNFRADAPSPLLDAAIMIEPKPKILLLDGHQWEVSIRLIDQLEGSDTISILDAGSLHDGTKALMGRVNYLVASEKFARQLCGCSDRSELLRQLGNSADCVTITLGADGVVWSEGGEGKHLPAFKVHVVDSNAAGDVFHGAFAAGIARGMTYGSELMRFASAAAALSCTKLGGRSSFPRYEDVVRFLEEAAYCTSSDAILR
ncbi:MAG: carbohydrate kinase [Proteobacteria bacterium]|nr:MAG: carbohydrate kinase [Pseudomonadota bacterium]